VPAELLQGHENSGRAVAGLVKILRENFRRAYEYVKTLPEHLIDRETMVRDYCRGELRRLGEGHQSTEGIFHRFFEQWPDEQQRFTAINALSDQYAALERELSQWQQRSVVSAESLSELIARSTWSMCSKPVGATDCSSARRNDQRLDRGFVGLRLSELPVLPADAFAHVRTLLLNGQRVAGRRCAGSSAHSAKSAP
jgi:hypothetical protein